MNYRKQQSSAHGFTMVELIVVVVLIGILASVAMQSGSKIVESGKVEETRQEMEMLARGIAGNSTLSNDGLRTDFGYVGDVGALPTNLEALFTNPGFGTWRGPYVSRRFAQITDDHLTDAWGISYAFAGTSISSTGSGSTIQVSVANATADLLINSFSGSIYDFDGTPPGPIFKDSISVRITVPNGAGSTVTKICQPDPGGYFSVDSLPIGNHDLRIVYAPTADTITQLVAITPASSTYRRFTFPANYWTSAGGGGGGGTGLSYVVGSDTVTGTGCAEIRFWLRNNSGSAVTITSMQVNWASPVAYYGTIVFDGTTVFNQGGSPRGVANTVYSFSSNKTVNAGQSVQVRVEDFRASNTGGGGSRVAMANGSFTVTLSDGTTFTEVFPTCP